MVLNLQEHSLKDNNLDLSTKELKIEHFKDEVQDIINAVIKHGGRVKYIEKGEMNFKAITC